MLASATQCSWPSNTPPLRPFIAAKDKGTLMNRKQLGFVALCIAAAACGPPKVQCEPGGDGSGIQTTDEVQYLDFVLQYGIQPPGSQGGDALARP